VLNIERMEDFRSGSLVELHDTGDIGSVGQAQRDQASGRRAGVEINVAGAENIKFRVIVSSRAWGGPNQTIKVGQFKRSNSVTESAEVSSASRSLCLNKCREKQSQGLAAFSTEILAVVCRDTSRAPANLDA
jgi:hypothetical protein